MDGPILLSRALILISNHLESIKTSLYYEYLSLYPTQKKEEEDWLVHTVYCNMNENVISV